MPEIISLQEAEKFVSEEPAAIRARKRSAQTLARIGFNGDAAFNANLAIKRQNNSRKSSGWHEPREYRDVEWLPKSPAKSRKANVVKPRTKSIASTTITYTLRDRSLYYFEHDLIYYVTAFSRGHITREELQKILDWIKKCA